MKEILLYGAGKIGQESLRVLPDFDVKVVAIVDSNANLWGTEIAGTKVISPSELEEEAYCQYEVIVAVKKEKDIIEELGKKNHKCKFVFEFLKEMCPNPQYADCGESAIFLDSHIARYDQNAGGRSSECYIKLIKEKYAKVYYLVDDISVSDFKYIRYYQDLGIFVVMPAKGWSKEAFISENVNGIESIKNIKYAFINRPDVADKYIESIKAATDAYIAFYGHDLHHIRLQREYDISGDENVLPVIEKYKKLEYEIPHKADVSGYPSSVEVDRMQKEIPDAVFKYFPLWYFENSQNTEKVPFSELNGCIFVGGFTHSPNVDGVLWFFENVYPRLLEKGYDDKIYIVGSKPPREILDLQSDNVIITGYVSDEELENLYQKCKLVIMPLRFGAGMKGKMLEALQYGKPVVSTWVGAEGLDIIDSICVSDEPDEFADSIMRIYGIDEMKYMQLKECAQEYMSSHFTKDAMCKAIGLK